MKNKFIYTQFFNKPRHHTSDKSLSEKCLVIICPSGSDDKMIKEAHPRQRASKTEILSVLKCERVSTELKTGLKPGGDGASESDSAFGGLSL